jgi:hypothetical protein
MSKSNLADQREVLDRIREKELEIDKIKHSLSLPFHLNHILSDLDNSHEYSKFKEVNTIRQSHFNTINLLLNTLLNIKYECLSGKRLVYQPQKV